MIYEYDVVVLVWIDWSWGAWVLLRSGCFVLYCCFVGIGGACPCLHVGSGVDADVDIGIDIGIGIGIGMGIGRNWE